MKKKYIIVTEDNWYVAIHPKLECSFLANERMNVPPITYNSLQEAEKGEHDFGVLQNANKRLILRIVEKEG